MTPPMATQEPTCEELAAGFSDVLDTIAFHPSMQAMRRGDAVCIQVRKTQHEATNLGGYGYLWNIDVTHEGIDPDTNGPPIPKLATLRDIARLVALQGNDATVTPAVSALIQVLKGATPELALSYAEAAVSREVCV